MAAENTGGNSPFVDLINKTSENVYNERLLANGIIPSELRETRITREGEEVLRADPHITKDMVRDYTEQIRSGGMEGYGTFLGTDTASWDVKARGERNDGGFSHSQYTVYAQTDAGATALEKLGISKLCPDERVSWARLVIDINAGSDINKDNGRTPFYAANIVTLEIKPEGQDTYKLPMVVDSTGTVQAVIGKEPEGGTYKADIKEGDKVLVPNKAYHIGFPEEICTRTRVDRHMSDRVEGYFSGIVNDFKAELKSVAEEIKDHRVSFIEDQKAYSLIVESRMQPLEAAFEKLITAGTELKQAHNEKVSVPATDTEAYKKADEKVEEKAEAYKAALMEMADLASYSVGDVDLKSAAEVYYGMSDEKAEKVEALTQIMSGQAAVSDDSTIFKDIICGGMYGSVSGSLDFDRWESLSDEQKAEVKSIIDAYNEAQPDERLKLTYENGEIKDADGNRVDLNFEMRSSDISQIPQVTAEEKGFADVAERLKNPHEKLFDALMDPVSVGKFVDAYNKSQTDDASKLIFDPKDKSGHGEPVVKTSDGTRLDLSKVEDYATENPLCARAGGALVDYIRNGNIISDTPTVGQSLERENLARDIKDFVKIIVGPGSDSEKVDAVSKKLEEKADNIFVRDGAPLYDTDREGAKGADPMTKGRVLGGFISACVAGGVGKDDSIKDKPVSEMLSSISESSEKVSTDSNSEDHAVVTPDAKKETEPEKRVTVPESFTRSRVDRDPDSKDRVSKVPRSRGVIDLSKPAQLSDEKHYAIKRSCMDRDTFNKIKSDVAGGRLFVQRSEIVKAVMSYKGEGLDQQKYESKIADAYSKLDSIRKDAIFYDRSCKAVENSIGSPKQIMKHTGFGALTYERAGAIRAYVKAGGRVGNDAFCRMGVRHSDMYEMRTQFFKTNIFSTAVSNLLTGTNVTAINYRLDRNDHAVKSYMHPVSRACASVSIAITMPLTFTVNVIGQTLIGIEKAVFGQRDVDRQKGEKIERTEIVVPQNLLDPDAKDGADKDDKDKAEKESQIESLKQELYDYFKEPEEKDERDKVDEEKEPDKDAEVSGKESEADKDSEVSGKDSEADEDKDDTTVKPEGKDASTNDGKNDTEKTEEGRDVENKTQASEKDDTEVLKEKLEAIKELGGKPEDVVKDLSRGLTSDGDLKGADRLENAASKVDGQTGKAAVDGFKEGFKDIIKAFVKDGSDDAKDKMDRTEQKASEKGFTPETTSDLKKEAAIDGLKEKGADHGHDKADKADTEASKDRAESCGVSKEEGREAVKTGLLDAMSDRLQASKEDMPKQSDTIKDISDKLQGQGVSGQEAAKGIADRVVQIPDPASREVSADAFRVSDISDGDTKLSSADKEHLLSEAVESRIEGLSDNIEGAAKDYADGSTDGSSLQEALQSAIDGGMSKQDAIETAVAAIVGTAYLDALKDKADADGTVSEKEESSAASSAVDKLEGIKEMTLYDAGGHEIDNIGAMEHIALESIGAPESIVSMLPSELASLGASDHIEIPESVIDALESGSLTIDAVVDSFVESVMNKMDDLQAEFAASDVQPSASDLIGDFIYELACAITDAGFSDFSPEDFKEAAEKALDKYDDSQLTAEEKSDIISRFDDNYESNGVRDVTYQIDGFDLNFQVTPEGVTFDVTFPENDSVTDDNNKPAEGDASQTDTGIDSGLDAMSIQDQGLSIFDQLGDAMVSAIGDIAGTIGEFLADAAGVSTPDIALDYDSAVDYDPDHAQSSYDPEDYSSVYDPVDGAS